MDKKSVIVLSVIVLVSVLLGSSMLTRGHFWGDDWAQYIMQAESILNGSTTEFMQRNTFTNTKSSWHVGPVAYPWGYPLILAPVYAIKGISPLALKLPNLIFFVGFLVCFYWFLKDRLSPTGSLLLVSVFALNPMLLDFLDQILSDISYLFFTMLALVLMTEEAKRGLLHYAFLGIAIFLTYFIRSTGLLLLASYLFVEFLRFVASRKDRNAMVRIVKQVFVVCLGFGAFFVAYTLAFPSGEGSYLSQFETTNINSILGFASGYFRLFGSFFGEGGFWQILNYLFWALFLLGAWARRKEETVFIPFFGLWMLVIITYPYWQGPRYIFPLLPIFVYFIFQGIRFVVRKLPEGYQQPGRYTHFAIWGIIAVSFLVTSTGAAYTNLQNQRRINGPFDEYSLGVYDYIKERTPKDSVVIFFKPRAMRLMTGHDTLMIYNCNEIHKGDYLVLSKKVGENNQIPPEEIDSCNLVLDKAYENRRFLLYQVLE